MKYNRLYCENLKVEVPDLCKICNIQTIMVAYSMGNSSRFLLMKKLRKRQENNIKKHKLLQKIVLGIKVYLKAKSQLSY